MTIGREETYELNAWTEADWLTHGQSDSNAKWLSARSPKEERDNRQRLARTVNPSVPFAMVFPPLAAIRPSIPEQQEPVKCLARVVIGPGPTIGRLRTTPASVHRRNRH